ncbi:uncharacterized protein F4822DRAFT_289047 [Hypoxylon trugodes]|uniref:uncharacterized protein n=1 Tax=Hypoxylon trugodes TaxID=326681 RepID=UPI00218DE701|nr:uncharacterized protein F4822DRAFT_289047 [Hypoxylon trugodes]KAI1387631.1 hypothetical protein F4822DRAFT_289047 [Hypoxylon trugodes]
MVGKRSEKVLKSGGVPDDVSARRERGKLAQRAFRQRQIDTIRKLEGENERLREAIGTISDATRRGDTALHSAISNARRVAGLPIVELEKRPSAPAVTRSDNSGWSSSTSNDDAAPVSSPDDDMFELLASSYVASEPVDDWSQPSYPIAAGNTETFITPAELETFENSTVGNDTIVCASNPAYDTEAFNPMGALTTCFEPDRAIHVSVPPADIVPYMGRGAYTLAGQIYWTSLAFGFQALRAFVNSSAPPPAAADIVSDIFVHSQKRIALPRIMYLMHARLSFRRYGYFHLMSAEHWDEVKYFLNPAAPIEMKKMLAVELSKIGLHKDDFLSPFDIEVRLRERFRDDYSLLEAALKGQAADEAHVVCMRQLMQITARNSICFGDGPRWRPSCIDKLGDMWETCTGMVAAVS